MEQAREIGGYFGLEVFAGTEYHKDLIGVNSGRNALQYIMLARGYKKLYIPRFLCDTVAKLCDREGYAYEEYGVDEHFRPLFDGELGKDEALYIVNFYGQITNGELLMWKRRYDRVIADNVQDFFRRPAPDVDTVYSCRKFFGVPDGGYVHCPHGHVDMEVDASRDRMKHILGRLEECGSAYYSDFQENDESFYDMPLRGMSKITRNILRAVDYDRVRAVRNANYAFLHEKLGAQNKLVLTAPDGPYCYPFYCENAMAIKRTLAGKKIYVPTLWPNVRVHEGTLEKDYAENIMPLPCDQRYGMDDMNKIVEEIFTCMNI